MNDNIILIGMPGAGKTTVGLLLAEMSNYTFLDTDSLIIDSENCPLQETLNYLGLDKFKKLEEKIIAKLDLSKTIISTGGSVVYSETSMLHLKTLGKIIFLEADVNALELRIGDFKTRGLVMKEGQSFLDLFNERAELYSKYADVIIACSELTPEGVCEIFLERFPKFQT